MYIFPMMTDLILLFLMEKKNSIRFSTSISYSLFAKWYLIDPWFFSHEITKIEFRYLDGSIRRDYSSSVIILQIGNLSADRYLDT